MELALEDRRSRACSVRIRVSILVFVELALEGRLTANRQWLALGFNPCFCGTRPRSLTHLFAFRARFLVSILVFVELALEECLNFRSSSLDTCFNPCFCGTRPRRKRPIFSSCGGFMFQSLFLWNSPSKDNRLFYPILPKMPGFNPCFCGTRPRSSRLSRVPPDDGWFQSLFLWNSPSKHEDRN